MGPAEWVAAIYRDHLTPYSLREVACRARTRFAKTCSGVCKSEEAPSSEASRSTPVVESYEPVGGFLPPVATKLTQSPWFLNCGKFFQPPCVH